MRPIYCYTGSKKWSTYYDAYFIGKYLPEYSFDIRSNVKIHKNKKAPILFTDPGVFCAFADHCNLDRTIACWWHGDEKTQNVGVQQRISNAKKYLPKCRYVVVSCNQGHNSVISLGVPKNKVIRIPLGVDFSIFYPTNKEQSRKEQNIPQNLFYVGSFQRDTDKRGGPKTIKGPDVFVKVLNAVKESIPNLCVLLSANRRDYVIKKLKKLNIKYIYKFADTFFDMPKLYNCLDLYLVTSRVEGGPKAIIESIACDVPVISTKCGMAEDVIQNGKNGYICNVDDIECLSECVISAYNQNMKNIRESVDPFRYEKIALQYKKLFESI